MLPEFGLQEARAASDVAHLEVEAARVHDISELSADHSFKVRQINSSDDVFHHSSDKEVSLVTVSSQCHGVEPLSKRSLIPL